MVGANGCGKSSLLKLLLGELRPRAGRIRLSAGLDVAYMGQYAEFADESLTVLEEILEAGVTARGAAIGEGDARDLLARYGFRDRDVYKCLSMLSGGERSRVYLCTLLLEHPALLFLDEPTNHLDIHSKEILEDALADYHGAVLAVSHDRYFIQRIGDHILGFLDGTAAVYPTLAAYEQEQKRRCALQAGARGAGVVRAENTAATQAREAYQQQKRRQRRDPLGDIRRQLKQAERALHAAEEAAQEQERTLGKDSSAKDYQAYADALRAAEEASDRYLELAVMLDEAERADQNS